MKISPPAKPELPGGLDHSLMLQVTGYNLAQASILTDRIFEHSVGATYGLKKVELTILVLALGNQGLTPKQLSRAINFSAPNVTPILDRLEESGLLVRERSDTDRRVQHLHLTRKGQTLTKAAHRAIKNGEQEVLDSLTEAERAILFELLMKIAVRRRT